MARWAVVCAVCAQPGERCLTCRNPKMILTACNLTRTPGLRSATARAYRDIRSSPRARRYPSADRPDQTGGRAQNIPLGRGPDGQTSDPAPAQSGGSRLARDAQRKLPSVTVGRRLLASDRPTMHGLQAPVSRRENRPERRQCALRHEWATTCVGEVGFTLGIQAPAWPRGPRGDACLDRAAVIARPDSSGWGSTLAAAPPALVPRGWR
jgi:hypothetical protein